jgi:hypothetical protein
MMRHLLTPVGLALTLTAAPSATPIEAQSSTASTDSTKTDTNTVDTYTTLNGYGLGRIVQGSIGDVTVRARAAMVRMKIVEEPSRSLRTNTLGKGWTRLTGKKGNLDVAILLKAQSPNETRVEVNARAGLTGWDKGFEEQVLYEVGKQKKKGN